MSENNESNDPPHIELYMYSLNQEFSVGKGHSTFLKRSSELKADKSDQLVEINQIEQQVFQTNDERVKIPDLPTPPDFPIPPDLPLPPDFPIPPDGGVHDNHVKWLSNEWIKNHTKAVGVGRRPEYDPIRTSLLRLEEFGAILFEPRSDRVYKLNKSAAQIFQAFQDIHIKNNGIIEVNKTNFENLEDVRGFVSQLKAMGLWGLNE